MTDCRIEDLLAGADGLFAARRYGLAAGCYRSALEDDPTVVEAHLGLAQCFVAQGAADSAVSGLIGAATAMRERGLFESAGTLLGQAIRLDPNRLDLHVDVAELELAAGKPQAARQRLESLSGVYTQQGQYEEAGAILDVIAQWADDPFSKVIHTQVAPMTAPTRPPAPAPTPGQTLDAPVGQTLDAPVQPLPPPKPRPARRPARPTAVLKVRPTPPPIAKPGTSASKAVQASTARPRKAKPRKLAKPATTPPPAGLKEIPPPAAGRSVSGAAADAKIRFQTLQKRAAARGFSRMVPKMRPSPGREPARSPSAPTRAPMPSTSSSLAVRLKLRSDAVLPDAPGFEDEQTRVFDLRSAVDLWDHHTQIFDLDAHSTSS